MSDGILQQFLAGNAQHVDGLPSNHFEGVQEGQSPSAVSVCCSDSRVAQDGMWNATAPGWLFTPSTLGNQVWDRVDGARTVDGGVLYPLTYTDTEVTLVVGHTGCGAVTAALEAVREGGTDAPRGVAKWIDLLVPVVEDGLADDRVNPEWDESLVDQLVEYNVDRQVAFLRESPDVPESVRTYGFVYDFQRVYGDDPGRAYLVNANGRQDPAEIREAVPDGYSDAVRRLL